MAGEGERPRPSVAAVLLAAGLSRRMGPENKLLLPVAGEPMVRRCARALVESGVTSVTVVLGHEGEFVAAALAGLPVTFTRNADYYDGRTSSVRAGLAAAPDADGHLMALADQPMLTGADIDQLLALFAGVPAGSALVPCYRRRRGNPVIMPGDARAAIMLSGDAFGCREFLDSFPDRVVYRDVDSPGVVADIDTPQAYQSWREARLIAADRSSS